MLPLNYWALFLLLLFLLKVLFILVGTQNDRLLLIEFADLVLEIYNRFHIIKDTVYKQFFHLDREWVNF